MFGNCRFKPAISWAVVGAVDAEIFLRTNSIRAVVWILILPGTWREWQTVQPATQVLYGEQTLRAGHGSEFSPGSPGIDEGFCQTLLQPLDERLPHNTLVLGVEGNGVDVAYPLAALDAVGYLLNVTLPAADLVILHQPGTLQALAFSRRIGDQLLTFEQTADGKIYDQIQGRAGISWAKPLPVHWQAIG